MTVTRPRRHQRLRPDRPERLPHPRRAAPTSRSSPINDLFDNEQLAYLLKYDTVMGVFARRRAARRRHPLASDGRERIRDDRRAGPRGAPLGRSSASTS